MDILGLVRPELWREPKGKAKYPNWSVAPNSDTYGGIRLDEESTIEAALFILGVMEAAGECEVFGSLYAYAEVVDNVAVITVCVATPWRKKATLGLVVCKAGEFIIDHENDVFRLKEVA